MDLNRGTGPRKPTNKKWIRPLEIVFYGFVIDNPPVREKLLVEVNIPEWLCMKVLEKEAT